MNKLRLFLSLLVPFILAGCSFEGNTEKTTDETFGNSILEKDENGVKEYSRLSYNIKHVSENSCFITDAPNTTGEVNLLVIPVYFVDSTIDKKFTREDIYTTFFGTSDETGWESVSSYYEKASNGKFKLGGEVSDWFDCNRLSSYYYTDTNKRTRQLVKEAVASYAGGLNKFDADKNGYIDGICLIYAAEDCKTSNNSDASNLWAYTDWIQEETTEENIIPNTFLWASYDFMYSNENAGLKLDAHTYTHEVGHILGLNDLYDYNSAVDGNYSGGWGMMDKNVGDLDPLSKLMLGWFSKVYVITIGQAVIDSTIQITDPTSEFVIFSRGGELPFNEYYLMDFYEPNGLNGEDLNYKDGDNTVKGVNASGFRLWKVNAMLLNVYRGFDFGVKNNYSTFYTVSDKILGTDGGCMVATTNTTYSTSVKDYTSPVNYLRDERLIRLIRNKNISSDSKDDFDIDDLFTAGDMINVAGIAAFRVAGDKALQVFDCFKENI